MRLRPCCRCCSCLCRRQSNLISGFGATLAQLRPTFSLSFFLSFFLPSLPAAQLCCSHAQACARRPLVLSARKGPFYFTPIRSCRASGEQLAADSTRAPSRPLVSRQFVQVKRAQCGLAARGRPSWKGAPRRQAGLSDYVALSGWCAPSVWCSRPMVSRALIKHYTPSPLAFRLPFNKRPESLGHKAQEIHLRKPK